VFKASLPKRIVKPTTAKMLSRPSTKWKTSRQVVATNSFEPSIYGETGPNSSFYTLSEVSQTTVCSSIIENHRDKKQLPDADCKDSTAERMNKLVLTSGKLPVAADMDMNCVNKVRIAIRAHTKAVSMKCEGITDTSTECSPGGESKGEEDQVNDITYLTDAEIQPPKSPSIAIRLQHGQ
jgi:hypothetical protein